MRSGGMVQMRLSKSMSAHRVVAASVGRLNSTGWLGIPFRIPKRLELKTSAEPGSD